MFLQKTVLRRIGKKVGGLACAFLSLLTFAWAQPAGTGVVRGQVLNESTGSYLNTARVSVQGTTIETYTNSIGEYSLSVPAGEVTLVTSYVGMTAKSASVVVAAGQTVVQDFTMEAMEDSSRLDRQDKIVKLEPMSVSATALSAQAVASTVKRNAGNIKDVISVDEFADQADGNIGEFIKYVPGLDIQYNPFNAQAVTIRGMPASGTLVQFDGMPTAPAASGNTRAFDLNTAANANIERIEITKAPTPDMPANAVGGSINVISKSGFSRATPLFTYNLYTTYNSLEGGFDPSFTKKAGPDGLSAKRPIQFAYDLSYILPVNKKLAFTFALTRAPRHNEVEYRSPSWNKNTGILNNYQFNELVSHVDLRTGKATMDWRVGDKSTFQFSYHETDRRSFTRQHFTQLVPGAGATGDSDLIQGAATGVGVANGNLSGNQQYRSLNMASVRYRFDGAVWKLDAFASKSQGGFKIKDMEDGFFGTVASNYTGLILKATGLSDLDGRGIPDFSATRAGVAVDVFDSSHNSINTVTSAASDVANDVVSYGVNLGRDLDFAIPTSVKVGVYSETMSRDNTGGTRTWTFTPPGGAAAKVASNHPVMNDAFSQRNPLTEAHGRSVYARYMSLAKLYDLYLQNPSWYVLNDSAAHIAAVNASTELEETITAGYARIDHKLLNNKLWLVYGVRYERTEDEGAGPLNSIAATYQRDAAGNFLRTPSGALIKITTNALANAQLQYTERGARKKTSYDDWYPSFNISYSLNDHMVVRAAYARTIGRPNLDEIIPTTIVTDPSAAASSRRATIVDGNLMPWTSNNFDLTFEVYDLKGATVSASLFSKNISNFFMTVESDVTPEELEELGLPPEYTDYTVVRKSNGKKARVDGFELSYRQSLAFIPRIGRHMQAFANMTTLTLSGEEVDSFEEFSPHNMSAGISYVHGRIVAKFDMTHNGLVRRAPAAASSVQTTNAYTWRAPSNRYDFSLEYRLTKRFSIYYSGRNLTATPVRLLSGSKETLGYLRPANYQFTAANHSLGIKGRF